MVKQEVQNLSVPLASLVIPFNSLMLLREWFPKHKLMTLVGSGKASKVSQARTNKLGSITERGVQQLTLSFEASCVNNSLSWNEVIELLEDLAVTNVNDVKITRFGFALEDYVEGFNLLIPTFSLLNLHKGIFTKIVADGVVPSQSLLNYQQKIKEQLYADSRVANNRGLVNAIKTCKGSFLALDSIPPNSEKYLRDIDLIYALQDPPKIRYIEGLVAPWILKELAYKTRGGVTNGARGRSKNNGG